MSRGLSPALVSAITGEVVARTTAVELQFASGAVRAVDALSDVVLFGNTFLGLGQLATIELIQEGSETRAYGATLRLGGVPRDFIALALLEQYQGRRATIYDVPLNASFQPIGGAIVLFRGRMDTMTIEMSGETAEVTLAVENRLADWERPRISRYTNEDQQRRHPGDLGLRYVSASADKEIVWPFRSYFERER
jgi:hypothetical protein